MRLKAWRAKQEQIRAKLRNTHIHRILGKRLWSRRLWRIDQNSIAGGLAVGIFVAFTPTIPFQLLIATCGAIYFRVNLPIALMACFVTNPVTALPIYTAAHRVGRNTIQNVGIFREAFEAYAIEGISGKMIAQAIYLWIGSLIFACAGALGSNLLVRIVWNILARCLHFSATETDEHSDEPDDDEQSSSGEPMSNR